MSEKERETPAKSQIVSAKARRSRPTIGVALDTPIGLQGYHDSLVAGATDAARKADANLICFTGRALYSPFGFEAQENVIYELISPHAVDGLIIPTTVGQFITHERLKAYWDRHRPMPVITVGVQLEGFPAVLADATGMYETIAHLIETHGYRRIAFIQGPMTRAGLKTVRREPEERYEAYTTALHDHTIPIDTALVVQGDYTRQSGVVAVRQLLDERKLRPGTDFEAIAVANDDMALGVLEELRARGIHTPHDVAVVGFDDVLPARLGIPALTTARQPIYEEGKRATEMALALLKGKTVPELELLSSKLVVRQSCGCMTTAVNQAAAGPVETRRRKLKTALAAQREDILSEMVQALGPAAAHVDLARVGQLLDDLAAEAEGNTAGTFLSTLDGILRQIVAADGDPSTGPGQSVAAWQDALSALRRHALPYLGTAEALSRVDDLWNQARVLVAEMAGQTQAQRRLQSEQRRETLHQVNEELSVVFDVAGLVDALVNGLPRLGIPSCYLALYGDPQRPTTGEARLILAYRNHERIDLEPEGQRFPPLHLVPEGMLPQDRRYDLVVRSLNFREQQLGFAVFELEQQKKPIYDILRGQISSTLHGTLLVQQVEERGLQIQTALEVSQAAGGILDLDELIQQTVDLARARFNLYYAGLFLVDETGEWAGEPGRWAVLRAGTGRPGRQMVAQRHKLEIGGTSMIGWCVANKQARIALDVGEEAVHFDNPLLPETRSEMALPLISRGEVIGALTIQSTQEAAFSEEDIAVFQMMANQLANAIANVHLFMQAQEALSEMETTQRRYLQQAWSDYQQITGVTGYETKPPDATPLRDAVLPEIRRALEQQGVTALPQDSGAGRAAHSALVAPIALRGAAIGALGVHDEDGTRQWTEDEMALIEAVAERMALAAENLRLLEQTQRRAARERLAGDITNKMRRAASIESIVQTAVDELFGALGTSRVFVQLGTAQPTQDDGKDGENEGNAL